MTGEPTYENGLDRSAKIRAGPRGPQGDRHVPGNARQETPAVVGRQREGDCREFGAGEHQAASLTPIDVRFGGEATKAEAQRVAQIARDNAADIVVGLGGGKSIDIAKAVAWDVGLKLMTVPTIAATDAPTSAASVWYDANSNFTGFECWPFNPDIVLVDTGVIAKGPARAFAAGMGDALSTWIETQAAYKTRAKNIAGGTPTLAALAIARLGFDTLMQCGVEASAPCEKGWSRRPWRRSSKPTRCTPDWVSKAGAWPRPTWWPIPSPIFPNAAT